jgi:hypothetical protein
MSNRDLAAEERYHLVVLRDRHFRAQHGLCYYCKVPMTDPDVPEPKPPTTCTIEHLKPKAEGGGSNYLNTAASCLACNNGRTKRRYSRGKDVPRVTLRMHHREAKVLERGRKVPKRIITTTYAYTVPSDTKTLRLANHNLNVEDAMLAIRNDEGQPVTLKWHAHVIG